MKVSSPLSRPTALLIISVFLFVFVAPVPSKTYGQKRKAQPRSASRAAGLVNEADKLAEENKLPEAIEAYQLAIRLDANYAPAHGGLGNAYFDSGKWEQGLAAYKEQVRIAPNDAQAQYELGYAYNAMGRHGEAFAPLVKAVGLDPSFAEAHYGIGYAYLRSNDVEKSISYLKSAARLQPDYADAYYGLGQAYARLGKAEAANEQLRKLTTIDAKLSRKLEKEMPTLLAAAATSSSNSEQSTRKVSASPLETVAPAQLQDSIANTQPAASSTLPESQKTDNPVEATSRQLQQLPSGPQKLTTEPTAPSPAGSAESQSNQVRSLPLQTKRWALVIGVDKYLDPQISPLKGSDNDARLIADALVRYSGFPRDQVILLSTDQPIERQPTRVNILRRLSNLSTAVPKDGLLLISFAGHGMEREGQPFLLPSDAQVSDQISFLEETAISINRMKQRIKETGVGQVLVLLDACRNDPGGRADAPNTLSNTYVNAFNFDVRNREVQAFATIYATGIGQRAYEYTEKKQGYFSWAIVEGMKGAASNEKGEITLSQLVKFVQDTVPKRIAIDLGSTKQQKPFAVIEGYRADELVVAITNNASMPNTATTPNIATVDPAAIELSYWDTIKNSTNPEDFKGYLEKYPDGQFAALAKSRAHPSNAASADSGSMEVAYWNAVKDSKNPADFKAYVAKFPNGMFADLANSRLSAIESEERERAAAKERSIGDTTWVGKIKTKAIIYGTDLKIEFLTGGVFAGTYQDETVTIVPGFLSNSEKREPKPVNLSGTWTQDGNTLVVQLLQPQPGVMRLAIADNKIEGAIQGTDQFTVQRIITKPMSSQPCDLRGFGVTISYRVKDKIDRTAEANKIAERLRGYGMDVKVEQYNEKYWPTGLRFYNGQGNIANLIIECLKDVSQLQATDAGNASLGVNHFNIWLQK